MQNFEEKAFPSSFSVVFLSSMMIVANSNQKEINNNRRILTEELIDKVSRLGFWTLNH